MDSETVCLYVFVVEEVEKYLSPSPCTASFDSQSFDAIFKWIRKSRV